MIRGQEGFVCGWQSKKGTNGQLVLDTLFVKLKEPPTRVEVPGLPENVVPVYPTTKNINTMLPNDEKLLISCTQIEVLINFAMTDFASQGKTRPWNVCDLNNLRSHQSYYTALSRSATAESTLILQGFDPKVITGRCSGALRQEFRELELLNEITRLHHSRKLPLTITGDTRINLIVAFREWKGEQYVPQNVHPSIKWSKYSPWLESEVLSVNERLELLEKLREKRAAAKKGEKKVANDVNTSHISTINNANRDSMKRRPSGVQVQKHSYHTTDENSTDEGRKEKGNAAKRRCSSGLHTPSLVCASQYVSVRVPAATKQKTDELSHAGHYVVPIGC